MAPRQAFVETAVHAEVESGELYVDDNSYGTSPDGTWGLALPPGPHLLEVRQRGRSVTSSTVTLREGGPATIDLTTPARENLPPIDAGTASAQSKPADRRSTARSPDHAGLTSAVPSDASSRSRYDVTSAPGVVFDTSSGLRWQRELPSTYAGCSGQYMAKGHVGDACAWAEAKDYCAQLVLNGQNGWRLPSLSELQSIVDGSSAVPAIDRSAFPKTPPHYFWTSSPNRYGPETGKNAWSVDFYYGYSAGYDVDNAYRVRCVR